MTYPVKALVLGCALVALGLYVAQADDPPGVAVIGFLLMSAGVLLGVRSARERLPGSARYAAFVVGVLIAAFAAFRVHSARLTAPLFAQPANVPSVSEPAPSPQWTA